MRKEPESRFNAQGSLAFVSVTATCFAQFLFMRSFPGEPWQVPVTFGLGAVYSVLMLVDSHCERRFGRGWGVGLYLVECLLATAMVYVSPARGFFGIVVLPLVSQAIFDYGALWAVAVGAYFYVALIGVFVVYNGWGAIPEVALSYFAAFAFTVIFSAMTKRAVAARERAEELSRELEEANRRLREHAAQAGEFAATQERNRLAREIHDGLGHYLTVVKVQLDAAGALLPGQPDRARESVEKAAALAASALDDVRRSVGALRSEAKRPPLAEALRELAREAGLPVAIRVEGQPRGLSPGIEHALFRSAQEGLTNVRKHAGAGAADLLLDYRAPDRVTLVVTDEGGGADPKRAAGGFGLTGIRERIEVLGGTVAAGNRPAGGFSLAIEVPA